MLALLCLPLWASAAPAAPPANDNFDNREILSESLPIEVARSNAGATKESEEYLGSFFGSGHSVWFEWEAIEDGWVTIGACEADYPAVLGVYSGGAVNALTRVAVGNDSEGPSCLYASRQYTFRASSGEKYEIVVDGDGFFPPGGSPPPVEGTFELRIEATPTPANDDFANALPLVTTLEEEFEGEAFYFGSRSGYNWNATEEVGEPNHPGGPSGASVWYSWTAPVSGTARVGGCCGSGVRLAAYSGAGLGALQPIPGGSGPGGSTQWAAQAGFTYWIAGYGLQDESSGLPGMGSFQLNIALFASILPASQNPPAAIAPDVTPPDTSIAKQALKRMPPIWIFRFSSTEPGSTFRCKLDRGRFAACPAFRRFSRLKAGPHVLRVYAVDAAGNKDPTPAVARFTVPARPPARAVRASH